MPVTVAERIRVLQPDGTIKEMPLEDYLRGVVAAALPADAPLEAMKALAVAARTFAANTHRHLDRGADVCTLRHCQAWSARANPRAARAVMETRGIVAVCKDALIEAFYFEHCDGKTREAAGVLLNAPAYLKSVTCPCGSAALKGHGIGMCKRGMIVMARLGEPYEYILRHYYSGIALEQLAIAETKRAAGEQARTSADQARTTDEQAATASASRPRRTARSRTPDSKPTAKEPMARTSAPRRAYRPKIEQPSPPEPEQAAAPPPARPEQTDQPALPARAAALPPVEPPPKPTPFAFEPVLTDRPEAAEADDLLYYLAVEDVPPKPPPPPVPFLDAPPPSMPEELPSALELEFIAPPSSLPEEIQVTAPPPSAAVIEPNLGEYIPPVEKFYTPLDAPPTFPEALPSFDSTVRADDTPFAWVPPPPQQEEPQAANQPRILMDTLPGPRIIAGNLAKPGMVITIRDGRGNSVVTVSGVATRYGAGGFEAPLTENGAYQVKFDGTELDVRLENETVFIYVS